MAEIHVFLQNFKILNKNFTIICYDTTNTILKEVRVNGNYRY